MRQSSNSISFRLAKFIFALPSRIVAAVVAKIRKACEPLPVARAKFTVDFVDNYPFDDCDPLPGIPARVTECEAILYRRVGRKYVQTSPADLRAYPNEPLYRKCGDRYKGV